MEIAGAGSEPLDDGGTTWRQAPASPFDWRMRCDGELNQVKKTWSGALIFLKIYIICVVCNIFIYF
jgi:hypothetical protein